jgi:hypothetical protein
MFPTVNGGVSEEINLVSVIMTDPIAVFHGVLLMLLAGLAGTVGAFVIVGRSMVNGRNSTWE